MTIFSNFLGTLRARILTVFSILLFLAFALVGLVFNLAVDQYIRSSAHGALEEAREFHAMGDIRLRQRGFVMRIFGGGQQFFYRNVRDFQISGDYMILNVHITYEDIHIATALANANANLRQINQQRLRVGEQVFYVSVLPETDNIFTVFHLDITDILYFSANVNMLLVVLVAFIWVIAVIFSTFLASSLSRPLQKLSGFARRIGRGNFTQNDETFTSNEFNELNQSLNFAARQLANYDNDQKTFFQNVSHELRTPLMSIISYAEGIKQGFMPPVESAETIVKSAEKLSAMVNDILYVSRIDNIGLPDKEHINLNTLIKERVNYHRGIAELDGITLEFISDGQPIMVDCVPMYIERAINNLISNSLRYTKTKIVVECFAAGARAIVRVSDDGPGFEEEAIHKVFERFYKGTSGLTGIGLSIVRSIMEQHNGTATAENSINGGAVLTISLPWNPRMKVSIM